MHRPVTTARSKFARGILFGLAGLLTGAGLVCLTAPLNPLGASATGNSAPLDGVLLDFTATWCGPCQKMSPIVSRLQQQGYPVRKVDVDQDRQLAERYSIKTIPCFVLVVSGREVMRRTGETSEAQLRHMLMQIPEYQRELPKQAPGNQEWKIADNTDESTAKSPFPADLAEPSMPPMKAEKSEPPKKDSGWTFPILPRLNPKKPEKERATEPYIARAKDPQEPIKTPAPSTASVHTRLRVKDKGGVNFGSGTVIDSRIGRSLILTCGHLFRDLKPGAVVEVDLFDRNRKPETFVGQIVDFDLAADVGLVAIPTPAVLPTVNLAALEKPLQRGDTVMSVGCGGGEVPSGESLEITAINKYDGPDNVECTGVPVRGRSGGGLFRGEELIGVCIAADPKEKRGLYCGLKPVYALVAKAGFGHLLPAKQPDITPSAAPASAIAKTEPANPATPLPESNSISAFDPGADAISAAPAVTGMEVSVDPVASALQQSPDAEVICIVRPKNSTAPSRVVIVNQASPKLLSYLLETVEPVATTPERKSDLIPTSASASTSANREFQPREAAPRRPQSPRSR